MAVGRAISVSLAIPAVRVWCRALYAQLYEDEKALTVMLSRESLRELGMLLSLLQTTNGSGFLDPAHDMEMWVDSGECGWGTHVAGLEVRGHFAAEWIGTSSTARELRGLYLAITHPAVAPTMRGKTVQLNMDSMCSVRNLCKGGGSVQGLVLLIKAIWVFCRDNEVRLLPRWQRRSELMMQRVDDLSKVYTYWTLKDTFVAKVEREHGLTPVFPDVARAGPAVSAVLARGLRAALVLPRWEGQAWWALTQRSCIQCIALEALAMEDVLHGNGHGLPRWELCMCIF